MRIAARIAAEANPRPRRLGVGLESALKIQRDEHQRGNRGSSDSERKARDSEKSANIDETT